MDILRPKALASLAGSLARSADTIQRQGDTSTSIARARNLLLFLKSTLEDVNDESEISIYSSLTPILKNCENAMVAVETFLNEISPSPNKPLNALDAPTGEWVDKLEPTLEELYNCTNVLSLSRDAGLALKGENGKISQFEVVQQRFDALAKDIRDAAKQIFQPVDPDIARLMTFTVNELVMARRHQSDTTKEYRVVCPGARLYESTGRISKVFRCRCCCNNATHEAQLSYRLYPGKSLLKEEIDPDGVRQWSILLLKSDKAELVIVRLSNVSPIYISQVQDLASKIAMALVRKQASLSNKREVSSNDRAKIASDRANEYKFIETIQNDWEFPSSKICSVMSESAGVKTLLSNPSSVELKQYCVIPNSLTEKNTEALNLEIIVPQSCFRLILRESPIIDTEKEVLVTKDTQIFHDTNPLGRLIVTLQDAMVSRDGKPSDEGEKSDVHFGFDLRGDAEVFARYVKAAQARLREIFIQGAFNKEKTVYFRYENPKHIIMADRIRVSADLRREFHVVSRNGAPASVRFMIVSQNANTRSKREYRAIVSQDVNAGSICFDFKAKASEIARRGLVNSLHDIEIWVSDYDENGKSVISQTNWEKLNRRGTNLSNEGGTFVKSGNERTARDWQDEVDKLIKVMKGNKKDPYERVKIAIIDSGLNDRVKRRYMAQNEVVYKDFTNEIHNNSWHGTCCAGIVCDIYEESRLFIARVFEKDHANDEEGPVRMAQAIEWAIKTPNSVDIISISAGFRNYSKELDDAVTKAKAAGVLVIAAASNWQNTGTVAFPARHNLSTMCIYSTNTGNQSSTFNPEPRSDTPNFALLGEGFQHPDQTRNERMSGTSMATAVAAGLAARIMDFSRQKDNKSYIYRSQDVGKLPGMLSIFSYISKPAGSLRYVAPLDLLPLGYVSNKERGRQRVREILTLAMERAN